MFSIIDGTGAYNDQEYYANMARSFCWQLNIAIKGSLYYRGPGATGYNCDTIASTVTGDIRRAKSTPIYLAGYSRGGAIAIQVAKYLAADKIVTGPYGAYKPNPTPVEAMFLFDPVGYTTTIDFTNIPSNVKRCYVLFRDTSIRKEDFFLPKWEVSDWRDFLIGCLAKDEDRYAREWMGNCKTTPDDPKQTAVYPAPIAGASHGAAGGVPWVERAEDKKATELAAAWMSGCLRHEGFKVELKQRWFTRYSARDHPKPTPIPRKDELPPNWRTPSQNFKRPGEM